MVVFTPPGVRWRNFRFRTWKF